MAETVVKIQLDCVDILIATAELLMLFRDGQGVPDHIAHRLAALLDSDDLIEWDGTTARPSPELLSIIATLRALRR